MSGYYKETQKFTQIWLWAVIIAGVVPVIGLVTYGFLSQLITGTPWGDKPMSDTGLTITTVLTWAICGGILLIFISAELLLEIKDRAIYYQFSILSPRMKKIDLGDLEKWQVRKFGIFEFGGYGVKHRLGRKTGLIVKGNMGLELFLKDGRIIMIGTQHPEEVKKIMQDEWDRYNDKIIDG